MVGAAAKPKTITACANKKTGVMRYSASNKCTKLESTVSLGNSVKNGTDITALSKKTDAFIAAGTKGLVDIGTSLTGTIAPALTALGTAAGLYADFEYGVAQLYAGDDPMSLAFVMTPRLDPTVNMSIATASFPCLANAADTKGCDVGDIITAKVAVRSANHAANDLKSTVNCGVNISQGNPDTDTTNMTGSRWVQTLSSTTGPIVPITPRSVLEPVSDEDKAAFLVGFKSTDSLTNVTTAANSVNQKYILQETQNALTKASTGTAGTLNYGVGGFEVQNTNDVTGLATSYGTLAATLTAIKNVHLAAATAGTDAAASGTLADVKTAINGVYTTYAAVFGTAFDAAKVAVTATTTAADAIAYATAQKVANTAAATGMTASAAATPTTNAGLIRLELRCVTVPKPK